MRTTNIQFGLRLVFDSICAKAGLRFGFQWLLLLVAFISCNDFDDDYSTNPNHRLSFSSDTISFDTVFTTVGSATRQFMIYNRNSEPLNIESIQLTNSSKSGFRINVDGRTGESFSNIPILAKDSMYILVEVTVDPTGHDLPLLIEDKLQFTTNGTPQSILLQAYGQDAYLYTGGYFITTDTTWTAGKPYLIYDSLVISEGATLTIEKGASFYMRHKAKWKVEGTLQATGTVEEPVLFRGDRLDNFSPELPYDKLPGQWDGIYFASTSFDNLLDHVIVRNGNSGLSFAESTPDRSKLKITNSQITNMDGRLFHAINCHIEAINTEFSNSRKATVLLEGGEYQFTHCTLVNVYRFNPGRDTSSLLYVQNYKTVRRNDQEERVNIPLKKASFDNCIIDGSASVGSESKPLDGELVIGIAGGTDINYRFNHCVIKTKKRSDEHFIQVAFIPNETDSPNKPQYKSIGNADNSYTYDFRIDLTKDKEDNPIEDQVAIGKADPVIAVQYPLDRWGINRSTSEDGPDIGAYEYVPDPEEETD